ncbi:oligosaccharide flippase family protein [Sphingomonas sp.]|uniref:oligosaccharide flippase family protein n=1 Tax=Sphingomonas sp. TaxID=28214 RepID=UPI0025DF57C4|nr:oligosaccharide flippase family protein [Sphingomonas sp.]
MRTVGVSAFASRFFWSISSFVSSYGFRLLSNVVLTRLLDPSVFGVMVVVNAMRLGIEILTDVGIEQNIVRHKDGLTPTFFNTAWTMQIIRGTGLSVLFLALAPLLGRFYAIDYRIFLVVAFAPLLNSLHSTAIFALVKNLEVKKRTLFEFRAELTGFVAAVGFALITPTVWALVFGTLVSIATRSLLSYRLPHPPHKLMLDRGYVGEIIHFGRWIMVSSLVMFAAGNLDRLTLGAIAPLALLGIYGLARTIAEIPALMARRLTYQIIFPMLAAERTKGNDTILSNLGPQRLRLVLAGAVLMGIGAGSGDWAINILYDPRYAQAGWMLSLLLFASWFSILSNLNEGLLMGSGKPAYESGANVLRFAILAAGLWYGYQLAHFVGAIAAIIASELGRYLFVSVGQRRMKLSFIGQDALATIVLVVAAGCWIAGRHALGFGVPWDMMTGSFSR